MKSLNYSKLNIGCIIIFFITTFIIQNNSNATTYCIPATVTGCASGDRIDFFSLRGESGTLISNNSGVFCNLTQAYSDYTTGFAIPLLTISNTYSGFLNTANAHDYVTIWIDFNNDGIFANTERLLDNLKIGPSNLLYGIRIPAGSTLGQHRLRVRAIGSLTKPLAPTDPCTTYDLSETEDYIVEITNTGFTKSVAPGLANTCLKISQMTINNASNNNGPYNVNLVDSDNNLVASIYPDNNNLGTVKPSVYIHNGPVRQDLSGRYYMNINLTISVESQPTSIYRFRYFFTTTALNSLIAQPGSGVTSIFDLVMTKTGNNECLGQVVDIVGIQNELHLPVGFGLLNGDRFVDFINLTSFSSFFLNGGNTVLDGEDRGAPLPVKLLSFTVKKNEKLENLLRWQVSNESNFRGYEIQKSENGTEFKLLENVIASKSETYTYLDQNTNNSILNYYRLKMIDLDGEFIYSKIIKIKNNIDDGIKIFPNPTNAVLIIENVNQSNFEIINHTGQVVKFQAVNSSFHKKEIDISTLSAGQYFLKIGETYRKFIKN